MSELSFLIELLLHHKLPKKTKDAIQERIKMIENGRTNNPISTVNYRGVQSAQAPSMQRAVEELEQNRQNHTYQEAVMTAPIVSTQAAAQALADRAKAINQAINGVEEPGRKSPRKF